MIAQERGVTQIQFFGDSCLVIQWINGDFTLINFIVQPLFLDIKNMQSSFTDLSFVDVYKNKNTEAYMFSKEGLELQKGTWEILEST
jgi:hypothetical protein